MAISSRNLICFIASYLMILLVRDTCQVPSRFGDFSDEDYYDINQDSSKSFNGANEDNGETTNYGKATLTADKIQDYLLSLQPKVLANNDVLTVKDKHQPVLKTEKPVVEKLSSDSMVQSDQPHSDQWQQNTSQSVAKGNKPSVPPTEPKNVTISPINDRYMQQDTHPNLWNCEFKANHDCGITNDLSVGNYFQLESRNFFRNFNWKSWYLVLNASALPRHSAGARLITPYLDSKNASQGCLSLQYITIASGVAKVTLYQQDKGNQCVWSSESRSSSSPDVPVNHQLDLTVDLFRGSPRFFLEVYLDLSEANTQNTIFALANFRLAYRPCFNSNTNYCKPRSVKDENDVRIP